MTRISKEPEIRKEEILNAAQMLFYTKGYQKTSVSDIVQSLNVAQGTFYYHFKSKLDVLEKMTDRVIGAIVGKLSNLLKVNDDAIKKLNRIFEETAELKMARKEVIILLQVLYTDDNVLLRDKINQKSIAKAAPFYSEVIRQGIKEGVFYPVDPDVTGIIIMEIIVNANEAISRIILDSRDSKKAIQRIKERMDMFAFTVEKILGAPEGSFKGYNLEHVKKLFTKENSALRGGLPP
ncbi:MAG: TetR/AcrR family transcriptional regulator [Spirochaetales bacterium]|nr:TetR/AcrR family transcriptional regulator [Spirochaetales bacterium]